MTASEMWDAFNNGVLIINVSQAEDNQNLYVVSGATFDESTNGYGFYTQNKLFNSTGGSSYPTEPIIH